MSTVNVNGIETVTIDPTGQPTLVIRRFGYRARSNIRNVGAVPVYLGNVGVTPAQAYRLAPGDDLDVTSTDELYGTIAAPGGVILPSDAKPATLHVITESWSP